jgi:hypothetical protein
MREMANSSIIQHEFDLLPKIVPVVESAPCSVGDNSQVLFDCRLVLEHVVDFCQSKLMIETTGMAIRAVKHYLPRKSETTYQSFTARRIEGFKPKP